MNDLDPVVARIRRRLAWNQRFALVHVAGLGWSIIGRRPIEAILLWCGNITVTLILCSLTARHLNEALVVAEAEHAIERWLEQHREEP